MSLRILPLVFALLILGLPLSTGFAQRRGGERDRNDDRRGDRDRRANFDPTQWLTRMDANRNGRLDPNEMSGRTRSFLERALDGSNVRLDLNRAVSIKSVVSAVNKARDSRNAPPPEVPGFGLDPEFTPVPGFDIEFGSALAAVGTLDDRYQGRVLQRMQRTIERYDQNKDGVLDRREIREGDWRGDPMDNDLNGDGMLTKTELAERYVSRYKVEDDRRERRQESDRERRELLDRPDEWRQRFESADGDERRRMMELYRDRMRNANSDEERERLRAVFRRPDSRDDQDESRQEDRDADPRRDRDSNDDDRESEDDMQRDRESFRSIYRYGTLEDKLSELGVEDDFIDTDANRDGQIQMSEYESEWTSERFEEFRSIDANGDGVISPGEWMNAD